MENNKIEIITESIFKPLNVMVQDLKADFSEFSYFNERVELIAVGYCDSFLIKFSLEYTNTESINGIKMDIFEKDKNSKKVSKLDSQTVYFKKDLMLIKMNKQKQKELNRDLDSELEGSLQDVVSYLKQWFVFLDIIEVV